MAAEGAMIPVARRIVNDRTAALPGARGLRSPATGRKGWVAFLDAAGKLPLRRERAANIIET
jgi:hypothetical protein